MSPRLRFHAPAAALALGTALFLGSAWSGSTPGAGPLAQARIDAASKAFTQYETLYKTGRVQLDSVYVWSVRWFEAQGGRKGGAGPADEHKKRMQALEAAVNAQFKSGMASSADVAAATYYRAEAELWAFEAGRP